MRVVKLAAALSLAAGLIPLVAHSPAAAQSVEAQSVEAQTAISGDTSTIPPIIPTGAFAAQSQLRGARLSPDGSHFAFTTVVSEDLFVTVFDAETLELADAVKVGEQDDFNWFRWAGNDRLLISMLMEDRRETYRYSRLLAVEVGSGNLAPLILRRMSFNGDNIVHIDPDGKFVLVSMGQGIGAYPGVYRFDLDNLVAGPPEGVLVQRPITGLVDWFADEKGVVRLGYGRQRGGRRHLEYRSSAADDFRTIARTRVDDEDAFEYWNWTGLRSGRDSAFVFAKPEGSDRQALMEFDFATGQPGAVVFESADADVDSVSLDRDGVPLAVGYAGDNFRREWIDPEIREWKRQLAVALPGSRVSILGISEDRNRLLVLQSGSADPGALYVFTPGARNLALFAEYRPQVRAQNLSEPRSFRYEARDGTSIQAYLTLPRGRGESGLPLIVNPHGGPYGVRDWDEYDDMVQLLANRGYAVVQPNFRGSGGYGENFELLGNGQIGRAMQDDLDDVVAHLVARGTVDPERVCILGASYGGFAALWGAIRNPEIYRCAVSFAGVTHFERQLHYNQDFLFGRNRGRWWDRVDGDQTDFDLDDVSPAVQVGRLTRPVLLVHGEEDEVVPYSQYELMVSRAERDGIELETLSFENAGHGFDKPEDEQAYYDAILDFLGRHNPAD